MKKIVLLLFVALCVFGGLPRIVAARNGVPQGHSADASAAGYEAGPFQPHAGFIGGDFADGGRSPFGQ